MRTAHKGEITMQLNVAGRPGAVRRLEHCGLEAECRPLRAFGSVPPGLSGGYPPPEAHVIKERQR
jgi:hypothetical protein